MILKYKNSILSVFLALSLIASFNVYFNPTTANAQAQTTAIVSNTDPGTVAGNIAQKANFGQNLLEWGKTMLGMVLKRAILDRIVDQTVAWIQSDFKGKPPFLQDPEAFKKQVVDNAVGAAIQSIAPGLCSPFSLRVQIGATGPAKLSEPFSCTLGGVVSNINNFEEEFSKKGGKRWLQYATIWEPQNNVWGATLMAESLKEKVIGQTTEAQNLSQTINVGFTATETCTPVSIVKTTPCQEGSSPNCVPDNLVLKKPLYVIKTSTKCTQGMEGCTCKIKTPGNFIATEVFGIASSNSEKNAILSSSDVATYIGTLLDAIISHYTQLGFKGLMGVLYPEAGDQKTEWDTAVRKAFSSLDAMTYKNTKTMYLDEIDGILSIKNSSLTKIDTLIDQENGLKDKLSVIIGGLCPATVASDAQKSLVENIIAGAESTLNYLTDLKDDVEGDIDDINSVKSEMQNSQYPENPSDTSGQAERYASLSLLAGYQDLKDKKILDTDTANKQLDSINRNGEGISLNATKALNDYGALADNCNNAIAAAAAAAKQENE